MRLIGWVASVVALAGCGDDTASSGGSGGEGASGPGGGPATGGQSAGGESSTGGGGTGGSAPLPCSGFPTFEDGLSPTAEVHVSTVGDDASGDGSAGAPFATLDRAADAAAPGTAIVVHAGTYAGGAYLEGLSGTESAPIWIGGAEGEARPLLQGGANGLALSRARYVVVHDLEISGATANGINCDDGGEYANPEAARFVVFRGLDIHDIGGDGNQDCLKLSGLNDFWVKDSSFARCGGGMSGSGIDHVGCHRGVIANSRFEQMAGNAVQCKGGSEDLTIVANHIVDGGQRAVNMGGSTGFEFFRPPLSTGSPSFEARRIHVLANVIERGFSALAFVGCVDCLAANNTIVDPENWVIRILQETVSGGGFTFLPASQGRVANNLVYYGVADLSVHVNVGADTDATSFSFANNLWYAHDDPGQSTPSLPVMEDMGLVGVDPQLVAAAAGDYHLGPESPAIAAGALVSELAGDRDGSCYASPPSIGAYEGNPP